MVGAPTPKTLGRFHVSFNRRERHCRAALELGHGDSPARLAAATNLARILAH